MSSKRGSSRRSTSGRYSVSMIIGRKDTRFTPAFVSTAFARSHRVAPVGKQRVVRILVGVVAQSAVRPGRLAPRLGGKRLGHAEVTEAVKDRLALVDLDRLSNVRVMAEHQVGPGIDASVRNCDLVVRDD